MNLNYLKIPRGRCAEEVLEDMRLHSRYEAFALDIGALADKRASEEDKKHAEDLLASFF